MGLLVIAGSCRVCGCTEKKGCLDPQTGLGCFWVEADLCSACVTCMPGILLDRLQKLQAECWKDGAPDEQARERLRQFLAENVTPIRHALSVTLHLGRLHAYWSHCGSPTAGILGKILTDGKL